MPLSEVWWSIFVNGNQGIGPNTIATHWNIPKATHQGKLWTKTWSDFLHLHQEDTRHMWTQYGNTNKGCYLPPDIYIGFFSVPDFPGCLVIWATPPWNHPICYGDLNLYGAYVCLITQGNCSVCPILIFRTMAHHICRFVYQNLQYPSLLPKIRP